MRSVVVLPAPFGPRNPVTEPGSTLKLPIDREYLAAEPFGQLIDDDPPVSDLRHAPISAQDL